MFNSLTSLYSCFLYLKIKWTCPAPTFSSFVNRCTCIVYIDTNMGVACCECSRSVCKGTGLLFMGMVTLDVLSPREPWYYSLPQSTCFKFKTSFGRGRVCGIYCIFLTLCSLNANSYTVASYLLRVEIVPKRGPLHTSLTRTETSFKHSLSP